VSGLADKAARGGLWYAAINITTQIVSWAFTFLVLRWLEPQDYGLMTMASFLTGYLQMFSELGLGAAIIQRERIEDGEMHSLFWLSLAVGVGMGMVAFVLSYPTAWLFRDTRVIPVTQLIGLLFVVSALTIVPSALLTRELEMKRLAMINFVAAITASVVSLWMALNGYGVYTLIWTTLVLNGTKMLLLFPLSGWRPRFHYRQAEIKPYLGYGIYMALSSTSLRLFQAIDRLIVGRAFGPTQLGLYGNAMTISSMPLDKIWPLYHQVTFPLLSRLQGQREECYQTYLGIARHYLVVVSPIYVGCAIVAPEIVRVVLGEKWLPMAPMFQMFCFVKLFEVLAAYQQVLFNATGHHRSVLAFNVVLVIVIPLGVWLAAMRSFEAVMVPWLVLYPLLCSIWILLGLRQANLSLQAYVGAVFDGVKASLAMLAVLVLIRQLGFLEGIESPLYRLLIFVVIGASVFGLVLLTFQRALVRQALNMLRRGQS
jgi:O-antigen/teichoic acid export membrane protein